MDVIRPRSARWNRRPATQTSNHGGVSTIHLPDPVHSPFPLAVTAQRATTKLNRSTRARRFARSGASRPRRLSRAGSRSTPGARRRRRARVQRGSQPSSADAVLDRAGGVPDVAVAELAGDVRLGCAVVARRSSGPGRGSWCARRCRRRAVRMWSAGVCSDGRDERADDVVDVDEVAGDVAVLVERDRLPRRGPAGRTARRCRCRGWSATGRGRRRSAAAAPRAGCRASPAHAARMCSWASLVAP